MRALRSALWCFRSVAALTVSAAALCSPVHAAGEAWTSDGPYFASVQGLAFGTTVACGDEDHAAAGWNARRRVYAAVDSGVWTRCGGSGKWASLGAVIWASSVAVDPRRPSNLYVSGNSYALGTGLLRSTDGGDSWQRPQSGLPFVYLNTVKVHPTRTSSVLAAGVSGIYLSSDFGATWQSAAGITVPDYIASLALSEAVPNLALASGTGGLYRSIDGGRNWTPLSGGLPGGAYSSSVAMHATRHGVASYAVVDGTIWRSLDRGDTWAQLEGFGLPPSYALQVLVDPSARSPAIVYVLTFDFGLGKEVIYRSTDGGGTWSPAGPSLPTNDPIRAVAVDPAMPSTVYAAATVSGLHTSLDSGQTWATTSRGLIGASSRVAVAPGAPHIVYAGSYDSGPFKSSDGGRSWVRINEGLDGTTLSIQALAVSPADAATVYAGTCCGIYATTDGGAHWSPLNDGDLGWLPQVQALAIDPRAPGTIYAGTVWGNVFKTIDGHNWVWSGQGLPGAHVYALAIDPVHPDTVYASIYDGAEGPPDTRFGHGVFKSTDGGATWFAVGTGLGNPLVRTLAVDPVNPQTVYAGTNGSGIFKSVNGGATWAASGSGAGLYPSRIVVDPTDTSTVYAATYDAGVFRSTDYGQRWVAINRGLDVPTTSAQWLAIDPSGRRLYLATFMNGVAVRRAGR